MSVISAIAGVISAVATVKGVQEQKKAARAQQGQQQLEYRRSQRQALREAQLRRAQGMATAQSAGMLGGSAVSGGASSLASQAGSTLGFASQMSGLSKDISVATSRANTFGAIAGLGVNVADITQNMGPQLFGGGTSGTTKAAG